MDLGVSTPEHLKQHGWAVLSLIPETIALFERAREVDIPFLSLSDKDFAPLRRAWTNASAPVTDDLYGFYAPPKKAEVAGERTNFMYRRGNWDRMETKLNGDSPELQTESRAVLALHDQMMGVMSVLGQTMLGGLQDLYGLGGEGQNLVGLARSGETPSGPFPFSRTSVTSQLYVNAGSRNNSSSSKILVQDHIDCTLLTLIAIPTDDRQLRIQDKITY